MPEKPKHIRESIAAALVDAMSVIKANDGYNFDLDKVSRNFETLEQVRDMSKPPLYVVTLDEERQDSAEGACPIGYYLATMQAEVRGYVRSDIENDAEADSADTMRNALLQDIEEAVRVSGLRETVQGVTGYRIVKVETDNGEIAPYGYLGVTLTIGYRGKY